MTRLLTVCVVVGVFTALLAYGAVRDHHDTRVNAFWAAFAVAVASAFIVFLVPTLFFGYNLD